MDWRDLARNQAGAITRAQLHSCDVSEGAIRGLIKRRELIALLPAVYSPRPVPKSFEQRAWAAALWSGGLVSHHSAAKIWELPVQHGTALHVTVERDVHRYATGVRVHRARQLPLAAHFGGLPLTTRATTIVDLLRSEPIGRARDLVDRAVQVGWLDIPLLEQTVDNGCGLAGNAQLRKLVGQLEPGAQAESERVLHRILKRAGITGWVPQHRVAVSTGFAYLDIAFPDHMVAIEVDGRRHHGAQSARFESDRLRQNDLTTGGWLVLRFTWRMLIEDPAGVLAKIRSALAAHPARILAI